MKEQDEKDAGKTIRGITEILLAPEIEYMAVRNACESLSYFFNVISGFDGSTRENQEDIHTSTGQALSPSAAAFCITDMMRTRNFLQGIKEAIDVRLKMHPGKPVIVFYAGTGPFATLLIPLTTMYGPEQLQMILLEINPICINYLHKVIEHLELEPYTIDVIQADATKYSIPEHQQPDILISETLKPGLEKEPWVSIVSNLIPQCNKHPILIPSLVKIEASLYRTNDDFSYSNIPIKVLLEFSAEAAIRLHQDKESLPVFSKGVVVKITERPGHGMRLILSTFIQIYNNHFLDLNDCGITIPFVLKDPSFFSKLPASLLFRYECGKAPGFQISEYPV